MQVINVSTSQARLETNSGNIRINKTFGQNITDLVIEKNVGQRLDLKKQSHLDLLKKSSQKTYPRTRAANGYNMGLHLRSQKYVGNTSSNSKDIIEIIYDLIEYW